MQDGDASFDYRPGERTDLDEGTYSAAKASRCSVQIGETA